jgi:hypothetical protein
VFRHTKLHSGWFPKAAIFWQSTVPMEGRCLGASVPTHLQVIRSKPWMLPAPALPLSISSALDPITYGRQLQTTRYCFCENTSPISCGPFILCFCDFSAQGVCWTLVICINCVKSPPLNIAGWIPQMPPNHPNGGQCRSPATLPKCLGIIHLKPLWSRLPYDQ